MVYIATYLRDPAADDWPFDHGDDPSFRSSQRHHGRVTWGVCRPNVRKALEPGDLVIFFAADRLRNRRPARYHFVGYATVDRTVRQTDIWRDSTLKRYRQYSNLLIRPARQGFDHFEPALPASHWHSDWLWRLCDTHGFRRADFEGNERYFTSDHVNGRALRIGLNYVLFRPEPLETFILADPPVVATVERMGRVERWKGTRFASVLRTLVLGATKRSLRTTNPQIAHPHIALDVPAESLRSQVRRLCKAYGFGMRRNKTSGSIEGPQIAGTRTC